MDNHFNLTMDDFSARLAKLRQQNPVNIPDQIFTPTGGVIITAGSPKRRFLHRVNIDMRTGALSPQHFPVREAPQNQSRLSRPHKFTQTRHTGKFSYLTSI